MGWTHPRGFLPSPRQFLIDRKGLAMSFQQDLRVCDFIEQVSRRSWMSASAAWHGSNPTQHPSLTRGLRSSLWLPHAPVIHELFPGDEMNLIDNPIHNPIRT